MQKYEGTLRVVEGDVTKPQKTTDDEIVIIVHMCNNKKIMGGGAALAIRRKWPKAYDTYMNSRCELGTVSYCHQANENFIHTVIANMVSQDGLINEYNPKPIKYASLVKCMESVLAVCKGLIADSEDANVMIHAPKFGSLRANGNWDFILELIDEIWIKNGLDVKIYEFKE